MLKTTNKKWFTMVELIIVVLILLVLWIIAYLSLTKYTKVSRDSTRLADIKSIRTSLELFSLDTWKYPKPDNGIEVSYSWDLLRTQWTVWDNVFRNISENLNKKPIDPLFETEYVYSITNMRTEYETMWVFEQQLSFENNNNLILEKAEALEKYYIKVEWTYNGLYVMTPNILFPTPSIINWEVYEEIDFVDELSLIKSQVITWGDNVPDLWVHQMVSVTWALDLNIQTWSVVNENSSTDDKILAINLLQEAYFWSSVENEELYRLVLTRVTEVEKLDLANRIFGWDFSWWMIVDLSCIIDWKIVENGSTVKTYSENNIDKLETYDCESVSQIRTCENTILDWEEIYQYSSCVKWEASNCTSQSKTYNEHSYILPGLTHLETLWDIEGEVISQQVSENNWTYVYSLTDSLSCNDGNFINFNESEPNLILCDIWYVAVWNECVFWWELEITSWDILICPLCSE